MHMLLHRAIYQSPTGDLYLRSLEKRHMTVRPLWSSLCDTRRRSSTSPRSTRACPLGKRDQWRDVAEGITTSRINMYKQLPGKLGSESARYNKKIWVTKGAFRLQVDLIEALFYMWRSTNAKEYRDEVWKTFLNIDRKCKVDSAAFTILEESTIGNITKGDLMPNEFLGSTLKFLYLTFTDQEVLSLDNWLFNHAGRALLVTPGIDALNPC